MNLDSPGSRAFPLCPEELVQNLKVGLCGNYPGSSPARPGLEEAGGYGVRSADSGVPFLWFESWFCPLSDAMVFGKKTLASVFLSALRG